MITAEDYLDLQRETRQLRQDIERLENLLIAERDKTATLEAMNGKLLERALTAEHKVITFEPLTGDAQK